MSAVEVYVENGEDSNEVDGSVANGQDNNEVNVLQTYWQQSDINLSRGMDFVPRAPVLARITHLQHVPFIYK